MDTNEDNLKDDEVQQETQTSEGHEEDMEEEQVVKQSEKLREFCSSIKFREAVNTAKRLAWAKTINPMVVVRPPNFLSRVRVEFSLTIGVCEIYSP